MKSTRGEEKNVGKKQNKNIDFVVIIVSFLLIIGLAVTGIGFWNQYRTKLIENQENQLLITSKSISRYLSVSLGNYVDGTTYLATIEQNDSLSKKEAKEYIDSRTDFVSDIFWYDDKNDVTDSVYNTEIAQSTEITEVSDSFKINLLSDEEQNFYFEFQYLFDNGKSLSLLIDGENYYEKLISGLEIGSNGYVMIKNAEGIILMHPNKNQWGIDVIAGRKEMYPDLDLSSLEEMTEEQQVGGEGISEYYSYWWTDPNLPRVKKISAYDSAEVGNDFWIVSAVVDYDDFYKPIADGFMKMLFVFIGLFVLFAILFVCIVRLLRETQKNTSQIKYLKELNTVLESVHRNEETIRHQQRLQIMGTMTGGIAHEFNNFLTPILGHAELLMMSFPEDSDEYDSANEIYEAAEKAKDVIRQISALSRKNVETVYRQIPARQLMNRFIRMSESVCPSNVQTESEIDLDENINILGNKTQINEVLLNVFVNAVHVIGKKEGLIKVKAYCVTREQMDAELYDKISGAWNEFVYIDIIDNGSGMEPEVLSHIFDPFFTTKKPGKGTGLGLALAEQIILSHRGYIYAESTPGVGSTFHIILPKSEEAEELPRAEESFDRSGTFLIADDNRKVLELLEESLAKVNIKVYSCSSRAEVRLTLREKEVDAIFVDESLADIGGVELSMLLRSKYPDQLIFLMASVVTREIVEAKQNEIINDYIEKPVSDIELINMVRREKELS